jgi:HEAT repeat protein
VPTRLLGTVAILLLTAGPAPGQDKPAAGLAGTINALSAFDFATRMNAARMIRRAAAADAVPALTLAARSHPDQFVRYRALVLLVAFRDPGTPALMQTLLGDRNDRVREVVYRWYEDNPDMRSIPGLLAALETEQAEFVRPALIRALAAHGENEAARRALLLEAGRGLDFFRSAVIETLGDHRAGYAVKAIIPMLEFDGPLQDDAILALGRIGDRAALPALASLTKVPPEAAPSLQAAQCLLGDKCEERIAWLAQTARSTETRLPVAKAAVAVLGVLATQDHAAAIDALFDLDRTADRLRGDVAVALATMALRRPPETIAWLGKAAAERRGRAMDLLHEGFDSLEEDFAEEQFYAATRAAYWAAPEGSEQRTLTASLIDKLEF